MSKINPKKLKSFLIGAISSLGFIILFVFALLIFTVHPQNSSGGFLAFLSACADARVHIIIFVFLAGLVGIALIIAALNVLFPLILYFLGKIKTRIDIRAICKRNQYLYKANPKSKEHSDADIEIRTKDKILYIHFIGMSLPLMRVLAFSSDREYKIFSTSRGNIVKLGGGAAANMPSQRATVFQETERSISEKFKSYAIPEFSPKNPRFHIFVVEPDFARVKYASGNELLDVSAEVAVGNIIVCKAKTLKKRLRGELHSPLK